MSHELTIQHLAPYLPYGLKFKGRFNNNIHLEESRLALCPTDLDGRFSEIKPILRPLSDLTREHHIVIGRTLTHDMQKHEVFAYEDSIAWIRGGMMPVMSLERCLNVTQYLFSIHADIFGLIEKGLAIDINTIQK